MDGVGVGAPKSHQYGYRESEQSNSQLDVPQRGNPLDALPLCCLTAENLYASEAKEEEIFNYSLGSGISESIYQLQSVVREKDYTNLSNRDYIEAFASTLDEQNEMPNFNAVFSGECVEVSDVSNLDALLNNDSCISESFEDNFKESFLCYSNIHLSNCDSENFGFTQEKEYVKGHEERQSQTSSSATDRVHVNRGNISNCVSGSFGFTREKEYVEGYEERESQTSSNATYRVHANRGNISNCVSGNFGFTQEKEYVEGHEERQIETSSSAFYRVHVNRGNISNCVSGNFGFMQEKEYVEGHEERQSQTSSSATYRVHVHRDNEFTNNYELIPSVNDVNDVAGPSSMIVESQRHPQDRRFICPLCEKSFHRKDYLVVHHRKHTGEKPYVCDKCGKRFATKGILSKHWVSHTDEKPFACDVCDKRFARKSDMTRHLHRHTGEKKYKCSICGKGFSDSSNRNRHYKKIHNKK